MRNSLIPLLFCASVVTAQASQVVATETVHPNVIFILTDDLGYGDVGAFFQNLRKSNNNRSEPWHLTPKLDTFAQDGMRMTQQYCPAPVCAPSRASLMLGVHQGHSNVRDNQFDKALENNFTLANTLQRAGYATAAFGKWGLQGTGETPAEWDAYPTRRGFDFFMGYVRHNDGHEHYPKEGVYGGVKEVWEMTSEISANLDGCYTADLWTARTKKWITDHQATRPAQPFFIYLAFDTPHAVDELPAMAYPAGGGLTGGLQWIGTPGHMMNTATNTVDSYYEPDYADATWDHDHNPDTPEAPWPDVYKRYATSVRRIDHCTGDLIQLLKDLGIDKNTLVVFTSDNGPSTESYLPQKLEADFFNSFGPFDGIKRDLWEGGLRVPTSVRWPGHIAPNSTSTLPCQFHDWMATFTDLAGLPAPARCDGVSLLPELTGRGVQRTPTVYSEYFENGKTPLYSEFAPAHRGRIRKQMQLIRIENYVGVRYNITSQTNDFEIYNVVTDPQETINLATQTTYAALQQQMKTQVLQLRRPDPSAPRPYDSEYIPASTDTNLTAGLITYATYCGTWPWVPEFADLPAETTGQTAGLDVTILPQETHFGIAFSGYLSVPTDGEYTFYLTDDAGAHLRIHKASVIDDDFNHTGEEVSGAIRLKAGRHPFRLYYRHNGGDRRLHLSYSGPDISKQPVPPEAFSAKKQPAARK